jgi:hypothetical protein
LATISARQRFLATAAVMVFVPTAALLWVEACTFPPAAPPIVELPDALAALLVEQDASATAPGNGDSHDAALPGDSSHGAVRPGASPKGASTASAEDAGVSRLDGATAAPHPKKKPAKAKQPKGGLDSGVELPAQK